ncbi:hypothetical protein HYR99_37045 [Candidatus Poribacteria bacterium]|nr:hypothetical protein [Candidatus Poribacteria bacterium]
MGTPPGSKNGGAILDQCSNFDVTGHSAPNFLAFNAQAPMSDGGIPKLPELMIFSSPVSSVQMNAGAGFGNTGNVIIIALDSGGGFVGFDVIQVASQLQTLSVTANKIKIVILAANLSSPVLVMDDLAFTGTPSVSAAPSSRQAKDDLGARSDEYQISDAVWKQVKSLLSPQRKLTTTWAEIKSKS